MAALPRSCKLLCSGREEASRLKEARVRQSFVLTTLVSPTPGETKKWGSLSLFRFRKRWASPPSRNTQVPDNPFTLVIPRAPLGPKNLLSRRIASTQQMPRLPIRLVFLPHLAAWRKVQAAVRQANHFKRDDVPRINRN